MKPKTKLELKIVDLSNKLPKITGNHRTWASNNLFEKWGATSRGNPNCLECGYSWKDTSPRWHNEIVNPTCPNCQSELKMYKFQSVIYQEMQYFAILSTKEDFQVVRIVAAYKIMKKKEKPVFSINEVMQHWISTDGKVRSMAKSAQTLGSRGCYDMWIQKSELEIKPITFEYHNQYTINPSKIYPERKVLAIVKRNGFKGFFYGFSPQRFFTKILSDSYAETLLKSNQIDLLKHHSRNNYKFDEPKHYWNSIKICIRNGYIVKDASIWIDYLKLLKYFNKDLLNPKNITPQDLNIAHDKLVRKKQQIQRREKLEQMKLEIKEAQIKYQKDKKPFFGLHFSDGKISVRFLEKVSDFLEEGDIHKHCVFVNEYYKKQDSLIFSARFQDKPVETIEVSISEMKIIQARGLGNKSTNHHQKIINLVNQNLGMIKERIINNKPKRHKKSVA